MGFLIFRYHADDLSPRSLMGPSIPEHFNPRTPKHMCFCLPKRFIYECFVTSATLIAIHISGYTARAQSGKPAPPAPQAASSPTSNTHTSPDSKVTASGTPSAVPVAMASTKSGGNTSTTTAASQSSLSQLISTKTTQGPAGIRRLCRLQIH
jgi:hypothetical protein